MLKIIMCEDDPSALKKYSEMINQSAANLGIDIDLSYFNSGEALLFHLLDMPNNADIIFLDIVMGDENGLETARKLRDAGCRAQIVFVTSCEDYVFEAFDVKAAHYLVKQYISFDKFYEVFCSVVDAVKNNSEDLFVCEFKGERCLIPYSDIAYFEIYNRVVEVHYSNKTYKFYSRLEALERSLENKGFVRVHRSYLVNLAYIRRFDGAKVVLKDGANIPVGSKFFDQLKRVFSDYLSKRGALIQGVGERK